MSKLRNAQVVSQFSAKMKGEKSIKMAAQEVSQRMY
jgi:hypothetical protein